MPLSFKDVAEILRIIDASDCEEVTLDVEGIRLEVRRGEGAAGPRRAAPPAEPAPEPAVAGPAADPAPAAPTEAADGLLAVRAPMVGTFYRRPAPEEPPFVEVGTRVEKGAPLCLIEVMKLYTTIEAPTAGVVAAIHVDDTTLAEFNQVLFSIKPE